MKKIPDEINTFSETIKNSDLSSIVQSGMEIGVDSIINDGILKDIPIVGTLVNLIKSAYSINTYLFLKKIIAFLNGIADIGEAERNKMISEIDESDKYKIKVGEKLLFILDKCDDIEKASLISKAFSSFIKKEIDYSEYIKIAHIINNIFIEDFDGFVKIDPKKIYEEDAVKFISYGICYIKFAEPEVCQREIDTKEPYGPEYEIVNGENDYIITDIGNKIKRIFGNEN